MNKTTTVLALVTLSALVATSALAQQEAAVPATSVSSAAPAFVDNLSAKFQSIGFGPAIAAPRGSDYKPSLMPDSDTGQATGGVIFSKNYLSAGYKLSEHVKIEPVVYFRAYAREGIAKGDGSKGKLRLDDCYVKASHNSVASTGAYNLYVDLRLGLPTSDAAQQLNRMGYLLTKQVQEYNLGRATFVLTTYAQALGYGKVNGEAAQQDAEVYAGPEVDVTLTPTLKATFLYEVGGAHFKGQDASDWNNLGTDFEPGLTWDITSRVNLSPFLDVKTGSRISLDTTTINAALTVTML